jgi:hypothetical protein
MSIYTNYAFTNYTYSNFNLLSEVEQFCCHCDATEFTEVFINKEFINGTWVYSKPREVCGNCGHYMPPPKCGWCCETDVVDSQIRISCCVGGDPDVTFYGFVCYACFSRYRNYDLRDELTAYCQSAKLKSAMKDMHMIPDISKLMCKYIK